MTTYEADAAWICGPDASVVQRVARPGGAAPEALPVPSEAIPGMFDGAQTVHFFADTPEGIVEIDGTAVYADVQARQEKPPNAYFFVGRLWDDAFVQTLSQRVIGIVSLVRGSSDVLEIPEEDGPDFTSVACKSMKDWSGRTVALLRYEGLSALIQEYILASNVRLFLAVAVSAALILLSWLALMRWVTGPLRAVSLSLTDRDASLVQELQDDESEFGHIAREIGSFLQQEEALRLERDQAQQYLDVARVMIIALDREGHITLINKTGCEILGCAEQEILGRDWFGTCLPAEIRQGACDKFRAVVSGLRPATGHFESYLLTKSGERRAMAFYTAVAHDDTGQISGILFSGRDITDSLKAHEALQASEDRYRSLMDSAYDAIFVADAGTGMLIDANQRALALAGRTLDEIRRMTYADLHAPEERERARLLFEEHSMKGSGIIKGLHICDGNGRQIPVEISTSGTDIGGQRLLQGIFRDVTDRQRYEEALRKSEERFRKYFELPLVGIAITSPDMHWIVVNDKVCEILGYPREELGRFSWADLTPKEDRPAEIALYEQVMAGERDGATIEKRFVRKDGSVIHAQVSGLPVRTPDGSVDYFIAVIQDITERKRAEEALRSSERNFRTLFNHAGDAIFIRDLEGRFLEVNEEACIRLGYARDELLAKTLMDIEPSTSAPDVEERIERLRRTGHVMFESEYKRRDETLMPVEVSIRLFEFNGRPAILSVCRDITDRRRAAQDRVQLEEQFRQVQKIESIGRLAGGIAHDFNNLLTPILGYADVALTALKEPSQLRDNVQQILAAAERARDLTRQLLAFSRKQILEMKVVQLNSVIVDFEKMMRRLIGEDIEVISRLDSRLGHIKADPAQIQQILVNLAVNARDAMPEGGKLMIETTNVFLDDSFVRTHPGIKPGQYVMLTMSDTGQGMTSEVKSHIFEPFFTTKEQGKGTGLGLATVYGIVKQHGGGIWVYSEPDRGTTFKTYLPRVEGVPEFTAEAVGKPGMRGSGTVLVVEDDKMVRELTCHILTEHGYEVLTTEDPSDALRLAAQHEGTIHLLLTDVIMPNINGKELYLQVAQLRPGIRVLYMSGYTGEVIAHHGILDDKVRFLQKPFSVHDLTQKVRDILSVQAS